MSFDVMSGQVTLILIISLHVFSLSVLVFSICSLLLIRSSLCSVLVFQTRKPFLCCCVHVLCCVIAVLHLFFREQVSANLAVFTYICFTMTKVRKFNIWMILVVNRYPDRPWGCTSLGNWLCYWFITCMSFKNGFSKGIPDVFTYHGNHVFFVVACVNFVALLLQLLISNAIQTVLQTEVINDVCQGTE